MNNYLFIKLCSISITTGILEIINLLTGKLSPVMIACIIFMCCDIITGVATAFVKRSNKTATGKINSNAFLKGILKKICMLVMIVIGYELDIIFHTDMIQNVVMYWIIANEGFSILENAGALGLNFKFLKKYFDQLAEPAEGEDDDIQERKIK